MQEVLVKLWCDKTWHDDQEKAESDGSHVLELDGRRVKLDLADSHYKVLAEFLEPWLAAGRPEGSGPVARLGFRAGTKEAKDFRRGLREWADGEGRAGEYRRERPDGKVDYKYPKRLYDDYVAYLLSQAEPAALWAG